MSAFNCIGGKAATGIVSKRKGKAAQKRITEISEALQRQGEDLFSAQSRAEAQFEAEITEQARKQKWRLVNRVRVMRGIQERISAATAKDLPSLSMQMVDRLDFEARSEHRRIMGRVGSFLEKYRITLKNKVSDPASFREFLRAMNGEATADASAKALAAAVNDVNDYIRKRLNSYGHSIGKLDGYVPHSHNRISITQAGFDQWAQEIDGRLDWESMINPKTGIAFGARPDAAYRQEFLRAAYDNIAYGRNSKSPEWGKTAEGNAIERHRVFTFKSSDDWIAYNDKFGSADPHSTLLQHWDQMARQIAITRTFGTSPETALDFLRDSISGRMREDGANPVQAMKAEGYASVAKGMLRVMEGGIGPNGLLGAQSARFFSTTRKVLTAALLDRAIVISVPSDLNSIRMAAKAIEMNPENVLTTYTNLLHDAVKNGGATRADLLRAQHIAESWANPGVTLTRFQAEYPAAGWAEMLSNGAMRIQGMNAHTDSAKLAFQWGMAGHMASVSDQTFDQLPARLRAAMERAEITSEDWDLFRTGPKFTASNGGEFLSPLYWQTATNIDPVDADRVFLKMQTFVEQWQEFAVPSGSLIARGVMDPRAYGLAPGGPVYELIMSAGMFKSFVGAFVVNQARMVSMLPTPSAKALYLAELIGSTTVVGALGIQIGEMLMGRDPQPMDEGFMFRALLRGGALGPVGDVLVAGSTSWGGGVGGYLSGPVPQLASDAIGLSAGNLFQAVSQAMNGDEIDLNLAQEIMDFQRRYTPMWQTPLAAGGSGLDRLISDSLVTILDPEALDAISQRETRRANLYGNQSWWAPGSPLPERGPNLSSANPFGQ